ncbi:hypothetical protein [Variovorax rhizosphaerae]|uniref:Novel STAND NTPase 1 domain-containing protein n=1 Tax=Variovorax rhizosphaerae TaxID=1836200 RepID=A0ABU8WM29_9BURK
MKMGDSQNPFVGLRPYEADETLLFFGRHQQVAELLRRLHALRFLAVVGSSGCGKSSLVRAGLIPVLQAGFLVEERDVWLLGTMKPGTAPLANLAACVLGSCSSEPVPEARTAELLAAIREGRAATVLEALSATLTARDASLLLLVDQFEEVFRFVGDDAPQYERDQASDFVAILIELAAQRAVPVYVVITMRSDFLGECDAFVGLPEVLNRGQYLVPRLTREQRRDAIEGPIRLYRQEIAARLSDRLLNETIDSRDDLPVLQHALMRTWDAWALVAQGPVDIEHYESVGTIKMALSRDADAALEGMSKDELQLTRGLFQALTTVDSTNRGIRRPARLAAIAARCRAEPARILAIVERFRTDGRLFLVVSEERPGADPVIDISHESLIRQWRLLGQWVAEEVESIKTFKRLVESARLYRNGKSGLYRDPDLQTALDWQAAEAPNAAWAADQHEDIVPAQTFLAASKAARDRWLAEREFERRWRRLRNSIAALVLLLFFASFGVPPVKAFWDSAEAAIRPAIERIELKAQEAIVRKDPANVPIPPVRTASLAVALAEMIKFGSHVVLYLVLTYGARRVYGRLALKPIQRIVGAQIRPPPEQQPRSARVLAAVRRGLLRAIEVTGKWVSVLVGIGVLTTCSAIGISSRSGGWLLVAIGLALALILVGWVLAVTRLNSEVEAIGQRLDENLADGPRAPQEG